MSSEPAPSNPNPAPPNQQPDPLLTQPELAATPDLASPDAAPLAHAPTGDATDPSAPTGARKAAAVFIFATITLDMLALGMIAPVLPRLIEGFLHGNTAGAARTLGLFATVFAAMQFFFSPVLGSLSDRFGRRPVVLLSNFGLGLDYLLMAWAPALPWLFLGRIISGITASSVPTAQAYIADVTPRERRAAAFGLLNAGFGVGFILGPALGGLLGTINPRLPFLVAGCLSLLNGMYGLFVLPESLPENLRSRFSWRRANPVGSLALLTGKNALFSLATLLLLGYIAQQVLLNVYVIYADYRFHWTDRTVGLSLATVGVFTGLYGALLVKPAVAKIGERGCIFVGLFGAAIGYTCFGLSRTGLLLWLAIPFLNLMSLTWPAAQSIMSHVVPPNQQGQLQGAVNSLRGIAGLLGPGLFTWIFSRSIGPHPLFPALGSPFFVAAALLLSASLFAWHATRSRSEAPA